LKKVVQVTEKTLPTTARATFKASGTFEVGEEWYDSIFFRRASNFSSLHWSIDAYDKPAEIPVTVKENRWLRTQ
jgi:hypothetical protein